MNQITAPGANVTIPKISSKNGVFLDTLAQLNPYKTDERLLKRARSKHFTSQIAIPLAELKSDLEKYYRNAYYCCNSLVQVNDTITGKYCNSRICYTCNRIRTAKLINGYMSQIKEMTEPRFVTLTRLNVADTTLSVTLTDMCDIFRKILQRNNKRKRYSNNVTHKGIRKLEVTFNGKKDTYHPHYHVILDGQAAAELMVDEWLSLHPGLAVPEAQNIRPVDERSMLELFKYSTKMVIKPGAGQETYIRALDVIMRSLHGRRVVQPYGGIRCVSEEVEELQSNVYPDIPVYDAMEWLWQEQDWINKYGECLTGYQPSVYN